MGHEVLIEPSNLIFGSRSLTGGEREGGGGWTHQRTTKPSLHKQPYNSVTTHKTILQVALPVYRASLHTRIRPRTQMKTGHRINSALLFSSSM